MKTIQTLICSILLALCTVVFAQNNALDFDGIDDYVNIPSISTDGFAGLTIEAWVYPRTFNPQAGDDYISNIAGHLDASSLLRIGDNDPAELQANDIAQFTVQTAGGIKKCSGTTALQANRWYHLAGTYDGANLRLYVNGILEKTVAHTGNVSATETSMEIAGSTALIQSRYLDGLVDELRIWNDARTEAGIRQNMYRELPNPSGETNLVAYYKFNETSGTSLTDSKGSYTGTLTNMSGSEWQTSPAMFGPKNALSFNGGQVSVESTFGLGAVSVSGECWVYLPTANENGSFLNIGGHDDGYGIGVGNGTVETSGNNLIVIYDNVRWIDSQTPIGTGWHHVAFTIDALGRCTMYLDGISVYAEAGDPADPIGPTGQTGIGTDVYLNRTLSNGTLDEVRIWSDVRTETEFRENMCKNLSGNESGLVAYYNLDNIVYSPISELHMIADHSGNGYNAFTGSMFNLDLVTSSAFNTWLNTSSTAWNSTINWSQGSVPNSNHNVGLFSYGSSDPVIPSGQTINNLVIGTGVTTQVSTGENLTLNGNFFNYGNFLVNSGSSLITKGAITNDGNITMQQTLTGAAQAWHMVSGPAVADISNNSWNPTLGNDDFYAWNEPDPGTWVNYHVTSGDLNFPTVNGGDNFVAGKGYLVAYNSINPAKSITGTPNNGNVPFSLKNSGSKSWIYTSGWNLLGNPYPSAIDWNTVDHTGTSLFQDNFAYVYDPNKSGGEAYITIDGGSVDAFIAPFQGFMVIAKTTSNDQTFTFTNAMRDHGGSFCKNQTACEGLIVRLSHENWYDETTIRLREESEPTRDRQDALKLFSFNPAVPQLYSMSSDAVSLAVNSMPSVEAGEPVAVGMLLPADGNYTLSLQQNDESLAPAGLFLEDRLLGVFHKLSDEASAFVAAAGEVTDRFYLHFGMLDVPENGAASNLLIRQQDNMLHLTGTDDFTEVQLFDVNGRLLLYTKLTPASSQQIRAPKQPGVYVVRLLSDAQTHNQKVIVH